MVVMGEPREGMLHQIGNIREAQTSVSVWLIMVEIEQVPVQISYGELP